MTSPDPTCVVKLETKKRLLRKLFFPASKCCFVSSLEKTSVLCVLFSHTTHPRKFVTKTLTCVSSIGCSSPSFPFIWNDDQLPVCIVRKILDNFQPSDWKFKFRRFQIWFDLSTFFGGSCFLYSKPIAWASLNNTSIKYSCSLILKILFSHGLKILWLIVFRGHYFIQEVKCKVANFVGLFGSDELEKKWLFSAYFWNFLIYFLYI